MRIEGAVTLFSRNRERAMEAVQRRLGGGSSWYAFVAPPISGAVVGAIVGTSIGGLYGAAGAGAAPGMVVGIFVSVFAGYSVQQVYRRKRMLRALAQRGVANEAQFAFDITPEGVSYALGGLTKSAPWTSVSEVFREGRWWVLLVRGEPFFLPRRFFDSPESERDFVAAVWEFLGEAARGRSPDAATLIKAA